MPGLFLQREKKHDKLCKSKNIKTNMKASNNFDRKHCSTLQPGYFLPKRTSLLYIRKTKIPPVFKKDKLMYFKIPVVTNILITRHLQTNLYRCLMEKNMKIVNHISIRKKKKYTYCFPNI